MMHTDIYKPDKLKSVLRELTPRFYLPDEFPLMSPDENVRLFLDKAAAASDAGLGKLSVIMKSSQLEALLLYLPLAQEGEAAIIEHILKVRANKRLGLLLWPMLQFYYNNENILRAAKVLLSQLPDVSEATAPLHNLSSFVYGVGFELMIDKMNATSIPLALFAQHEALILESPLADKLFEAYFSQCDKSGFFMNGKRFIQIFERSAQSSGCQILINYLSKLDRLEFLEDVNNFIVNRWGEPFKSPEWSDIPMQLRQKFAEWISYRRLALHFSSNKLKLRILSSIIPYIRHIQLFDNGGFMAADFGDFYIADDNELSLYSYLIEKSLYEKLSEGQAHQPGIDNLKCASERIAGARDFIIEDADESFIQLEYEELGRLYIMDMLNIKLKLTPDLRPTKSLIRKKRRKAGS